MLYTKSGDNGQTGLFGGSRIAKNSDRVEAYGTVDEAIACIGVARSVVSDEKVSAILYNIQEKLFVVGAELASDEVGLTLLKQKITESDVKEIENIIDEYEEIVGAFTKFIIPGDNVESAYLHVARTVVRRAERYIVNVKVSEELYQYINRVSDCLYVVARYVEEKL